MNGYNEARRESLKGRKFAAWICFFLGIGLLIHGSLLPPTTGIESKVVPAIVAFVFSLLFWGLVTVENVLRLMSLIKGQEEGTNSGGPRNPGRSKESSNGN